MAFWAEVDSSGFVLRVLEVSSDKPNEGYDWLVERLGGTWIKTCPHTFKGEHALGGTPLRKNFAGVGFNYNESLDMFVPPSPYPSWVLNTSTGSWDPPVPQPPKRWNVYVTWDEENLRWVEESME